MPASENLALIALNPLLDALRLVGIVLVVIVMLPVMAIAAIPELIARGRGKQARAR